MKTKAFAAMAAAMTALSLAGCMQEPDTRPEASSDEAVITVDFSAVSEPVYRVDLEYFLKGDLMGGMACCNADETPMTETVRFALTEAEFPAGSKREDFTFYLVFSGDQEGIKEQFSEAKLIAHTNESSACTLEYGKTYAYSVSGSYENGFTLTPAATIIP